MEVSTSAAAPHTLTIRLSKLGPARVGFQDQTRGYSRYDQLVGGAHPTGRGVRSWVAHECECPNSPTGAVNIRTNVGNTLIVVRDQAVLCCRPVAPQRAMHHIASYARGRQRRGIRHQTSDVCPATMLSSHQSHNVFRFAVSYARDIDTCCRHGHRHGRLQQRGPLSLFYS